MPKRGGVSRRGRVPLLALLCALTVVSAFLTAHGLAQAPTLGSAAVDEAFARYDQADTVPARAAAGDAIVASGIAFDEAYARLKRGRTYRSEVARGLVHESYANRGVQYFYTLDVPESYTPERTYQLRLQLHGGVGRIESSGPPPARGASRLDGDTQIYLMPYAWRDAPWWSRQQIANLRAILDRVKHTYNIDENRVVMMGVSDGGTGAYFSAMRDTTPFASFVPLNGFLMVLRNEMAEADGDLFPNNLLNKPLFIVNGGRDPLYPTSVASPYVEHLQKAGVDAVYQPQPDAGHDTSWWPMLKDTVERFVAEHPRRPLPDRLTWQSSEVPARAHWLVINRLLEGGRLGSDLPDVNTRATPPVQDFGVRSSGPRINRVVRGSNAQQLGLQAGDVIVGINNQPTTAATDLVEVLSGFPAGRPLILTVSRGGQSVRITGRYAPTVLPEDAAVMFPSALRSGRVDVVRVGNRVEAQARGVAAFTLLLSPEQFDFNRPVAVVVNGKTIVDRVVQRDVGALVRWAAQDDDRTMLFGAALSVTVE